MKTLNIYSKEYYEAQYGSFGVKVWEVLQAKVEVDGEVKRVVETNIINDFLLNEYWDMISSPEAQIFRIQNFYPIITKEKTLSKFMFNEAQRDFYNKYITKNYLRLIILKSRQLGMTTLISIYFLDNIIFTKNTEALHVAHTKGDMSDIFQGKVLVAFDNLPEPLKNRIDIEKKNTESIVIKSGKYIDEYKKVKWESRGRTMVKTSGRGFTNTMLHISELAKMEKLKDDVKMEDVVTGTLQSVPMGGQIFIESTAEGPTGLFFDMFMTSYTRKESITPASTLAEFYPVFYNWTWDKAQIEQSCKNGIVPVSNMEKSDIDWAEMQYEHNLTNKEITFYYLKYIQLNRDVYKLRQEYPTTEMEAFQSSGSTFFSKRRLQEMAITNKQEEKYKVFLVKDGLFIDSYYQEVVDWKRFDGYIEYQPPKKGSLYAIGVDVAEGLENGDYSVVSVIGLDKEIKAIYRGHCDITELPNIAVQIATRYNNALVIPETNKDVWVAVELNNIYDNVYTRVDEANLDKTTTRNLGWRTTEQTRMLALQELSKHFNAGLWVPTLLLTEMETFVRDKTGKPTASSGKTDDIVMATAIAFGGSMQLKQKLSDQQREEEFEYRIWKQTME